MSDQSDHPAEVETEDQSAGGKLTSPSFIGLLLVIFLGATNDNIFRWLVIGIGKQFVTPDNVRHVLMAGSVAFVAPYLLFAAPAGYFADRFSKSRVIMVFKAAEIGIMALGIIGILMGNLYLLFAVVFLMGTQSALFGPARYGAIPEIIPVSRIAAANGAIGLVSVIATVVGMGIGNVLSDDVTGKFGDARWWPAAATLIGVAVLGWLASLVIQRLKPANPKRVFPANPVQIAQQTWRDLATLASNRVLLRVALGITFFWALGALAQLNIDAYAFEGGATMQSHVVFLLVSLVGGVGLGCVLAGVWSAGRVELGILPLGAFGIMVSSLLLFSVQGVLIDPQGEQTYNYLLACGYLFMLGVSAGLFSVPLEAFIQHRSPPDKLGSILAASNFITFSCMLLIFVLFTILRRPTHEGDFANVDLPELSTPWEELVDEDIDSFEAEWRDPNASPRIEESSGYVSQRNISQVLLANLLWIDLNERERRGASPDEREYKSSYPQEAELVENVFAAFRHPADTRTLEDVDLPQVTQKQQDVIKGDVAAFTAEWANAKFTPRIQNSQGFENARDARRVLLANLLWIELNQRDQRGDTPSYDGYKERFPNDLGVVYNVYNQYSGLPWFSSARIFLLVCLLTVPVFIYIIWLIPQSLIRFIVWLMSKTFYRIRVEGLENLPKRGGALLIANHVSWLDGILLMLISSRPVRMIVFAGNFQNPIINWMAKKHGTIMLTANPKVLARGLKEAREGIKNGDLVCIFPEGGITRSGQVQGFKPGMMKVLKGTDAPVIPIYIDEMWGSIFSFEGGKFFWKWPKRFPYPITIHIGKPIEQPTDVHQARQGVTQLGANAVETRTQRMTVLPRQFIRSCKRNRRRSKVADSAGADMSGGELLMRTLILRRLLRRGVLAEDEQYVGVLLPPVAGAIVTNAALAIDRRIAVNLNYTVSSDVMNYCIEKCGIRHVLTSRKFMEKLDYEIDAELVYLEDFKDKVTTSDKIAGALGAYVTPARLLERSLGLHKVKTDDVLTIIFTSGSTGTPKGVMLTHGNVGSNVQAIDQVVHLGRDDTIIGILPLFHSFGYSVTLWTVLTLDIKGAYHFSPLEPRQIGKLCAKHNATILLATPTFLRSYLRRCKEEDLKSLDVVVAGAEKLPVELCNAFEEKFGVRPVEGFGATELSPLVSVNIPPSRSIGNFQNDLKEGSVGRPIPGVSAKIVDPDSGEELGVGEAGMLLIHGPNVMAGYLDMPEKTAEVIHDGWYVTGDIATIDDEGFITITGRQSRFSKIGGEMVPHVKIEECLTQIIGADEEAGLQAAITAVPDQRKGERLVVVHKPLEKSPAELCKALKDQGLPNLFIPSEDSFVEVSELPLLGTGKLDLKRVKEVALERFAPAKS